MGITKAICFVLVLFFTGSVTADNSKFSALKGNPGLRSASAIVLDSRGNLIYGKDIDTVRPIASITKLMTAMVILDAGLDLEEDIVIANQDRDFHSYDGFALECRGDSAAPRTAATRADVIGKPSCCRLG